MVLISTTSQIYKDNEYLGGLVYDFLGGGHLIPVKGVPESPTMLLVVFGLLGLLGLKRKFRK